MIEKYYCGVIDQIYNRIGKETRNIVMANYSNDFSIENLEVIRRYQSNEDNVFFAYSEFSYNTLVGAYEPFLDIICNMHRRFIGGSFDEFQKECGVYYLHRQVLNSYYETGECFREETVLLNEVEYEQRRMTMAIVDMLKRLSEVKPLMIVINRFQMASKSSIETIKYLIDHPCTNIGIVLGVNASVKGADSTVEVWDRIVESLEDRSAIYYIGSAKPLKNSTRTSDDDELYVTTNFEQSIQEASNTMEFLDYEQAKRGCRIIEHKIKFEGAWIDEKSLRRFYMVYARTSVLLGELSKALELTNEYRALIQEKNSEHDLSLFYFMKGTCYMYQGKLEKAENCAKRAYDYALLARDDMLEFKSELLSVMIKMSGWYNIFFCVQDIPVSDEIIEKLIKHGYRNHLAHIYIYAYDNSREVVKQAFHDESVLKHFTKGLALAKKIGNEQLVYDAYQKTIMLASTNGFNEIAFLYVIRTYEFMKEHGNIYVARVLSSIGYNLSAMGKNELVDDYYNAAINMFYYLKMPEDIAEAYYNKSLNYIMQGKYKGAVHALLLAMKIIIKLHLNSLRVCNTSKVYALLALASILSGDRFSCERYLLSCKQFLNYVIYRVIDSSRTEAVHDYARCDDEMFLYSFASAMLFCYDGKMEEAFSRFEEAEGYLATAEGNEFFAYSIYRESRIKLFEQLGRNELIEHERILLDAHNKRMHEIAEAAPLDMLKNINLQSLSDGFINERQINLLVKQQGLAKDYQSAKRQMEFISIWQTIVDVNDQKKEIMIENAMSNFINHFSLDCALIIDLHAKEPQVLYNDTDCDMTDKIIKGICDIMMDYPEGFATSKIGEGFYEHENIISYFGVDDVCSFVAVPFIKNDALSSVLIAYVRMKDNWHGSIERYMLNEDDLSIFKLLFRELEYSIARIEANEKANEMNRRLQQAAVTDMLTGIYNRAGMYQEIEKLEKRISVTSGGMDVGLMFIDLDNFKHYNDTYGHDVGDLILKEMASVFRKVAKDRGFVSRYGGDEFIIVIESCARYELENIAKDIYARIAEADGFSRQIKKYLNHDIEFNEEKNITCSIGISYERNVTSESQITELIKKADDLMYTVKTGEKGHYAFF